MKEVASYAAAYAVYQFPQIFFGIILVPVYSKLSRDYQLYQKSELSFHIRVIANLLLIALLSFFLVRIFSETVIISLFGEQYSSSAPILDLLSFALIPLSLNNYTGIVLNSSLNERKQMAGTFFGLAVNLTLNLLLLKSFGIASAAAATVITESAVLLIQSYFIFTRLKR
jgi:O-antigen/teichoic acid export membrane protein